MSTPRDPTLPPPEDEPENVQVPRPTRAFFRIAGGYWRSKRHRAVAWTLTGSLLVLGVAQIGIQVWLNVWNRDFFNALEQKDVAAMVLQVGVFAFVVVASVAVTALHLHIKRGLQLRWRSWLSEVTVARWLEGGRQYQLQFMPGAHDNPDGRIAEDIRVATEYAVEFAHSIFYCVLLLVSFLGILWALSGPLVFDLFGTTWMIPVYMVWAALLYAGVGSAITFIFGRPLVAASDLRQTREADFRFGLVRVRENAEGIALLRGEADERRRLLDAFSGIRGAWNLQTRGQRRLIMLNNAYGTLASIFPLIVASPRYFSGAITLGGLMQTAQAFVQVQSALSWFVDNFPRFAEWRASAERVVALHVALDHLDEDIATIDEHTIVVRSGDTPVLTLKELGIAHPDGTVLVAAADAEIRLGERVLIKGESGTGKSTLFRAVAGLWPWGSGTIELPAGAKLMFMPQRPYLPIGQLRTALLYPDPPDSRDQAALATALEKVGLEHLIERLDDVEPWDRVLSGGEQQRLAFARLVLHKPEWVFLDEATSALDEANQDRMMQLIADEFPDMSVLSVGHRPGLEAFHTRELLLVRGEAGALLKKGSRRRREALHDFQEAMARRRRGVLIRLRGLRRRRPADTPPEPENDR